jgi:predicted PolB exonuclease-like 3'-5' exonuclease
MIRDNLNHVIFHIATVTPNWEPYEKDGKQEFPPPIYHVPVAVSLLQLRMDGQEALSVNIASKRVDTLEEERSLVNYFFQHVPGDAAFIVSFNGRSFTLPVMVYRSLYHGVDASRYLQNQEMFNARFSSRHIDLSEVLSGYGALYRSASLSEYAQLIGLAKRPYIDVAKAFEEQQLDLISNRLEVDVLITAAIYFRLLLSQGDISVDIYKKIARTVLKAYHKSNPFAERYLNGSNVPKYLSINQPARTR